MHHANRRPGSDGLEYGIGNGVIAAGADRYDVRCLDPLIDRLDILVLPFQVEAVREVYVTQIRNPAQLVWIDAQPQIERSHEAGGIAYFARAMACAGPVGDPEICGNADQSNVHILECGCQRSTHECRNLGKARLPHRVVSLLARDVGPEVTLGAHAS